MPRATRNQVVVRRRATPYGAMAYALGQGVRAAINNRQMITDTTQAVKRKLKQLTRPRKKATTESKGLGSYTGGNDWTRQTNRVGRKRKMTIPRLDKLLRIGMNTQIYRFQNITNFDVNVGGLPLTNWKFLSGVVNTPVHVYDLTSFPNRSTQRAGFQLQWTNATASANVYREPLPGQTPSGATDATGVWQTESKGGVAPTTTFPNATKMVHNWTDVRLLFYGARNRTTRFEVMFIRVKDEFSNLAQANVANPDLKEFVQYLERPCIYNPLQSLTGSHIAKKMQVIKRFTYWVSAAQTTDTDVSVGKTKEARIFLRHDRIYNLDYKHWNEDNPTDVLPHEQEDGLDYEQDTNNHNHPWYGSCVFMVVRATAPQRTLNKPNTYPGAADANIDPTYDVIVRNSVSTPA